MINKEDILEGNKLFAEYLGLKIIESTNLLGHKNLFYAALPNPLIVVAVGSEDRLLYHESWDWSMPVVDKINGLGKEFSLAIFKNYVSLTVEKGGKVYKDFSFAHAEYITAEQTGKEATFKLIVKFIKWYNENIIKKIENIQDGNNT